jgi:hypothetical protein
MKTATLIIDIGDAGVSRIQITADDPAARQKALKKVQDSMTAIELLENLMNQPSKEADRDEQPTTPQS